VQKHGLARAFPEALFVIASDGNEIEDMKRLAREVIPPGQYEFVGFVPDADVRRFYNELDLFLFPSRYGFGMSPVEASACGTPAIVGRTLDSTDFFTNEISLVDPNSSEELAQRIFLLGTSKNSWFWRFCLS
jgi:glycosyltransferase involved in cell wall biosynthesis